MEREARQYVYTIPYEGKFIVYRPLKRLAFLANRAMVNFIGSLIDEKEKDGKGEEAYRFLERIGFMQPDPPPPEPAPPDGSFKPTMAVLFTTTACNFRCVYCYASGGERAVQILPFENGCAAIDHVYRNAVEKGEDRFSVGFHGGGEPTLAKETFRRLVHYARGKGLPCEITVATNGYWGEDERDWILNNINSVSLSFDGIREIHDRQRPLASGAGTHRVILTLIREMDRRSFPYGIRLTVTDGSIDQLPESIDFLCRETSCGTFHVEPAFAHGRALLNGSALSEDPRFASVFLEAYDIAASYGRHCYYSGARPWAITSCFCQAFDKALILTHDSLVTSCYEIYSRRHPLASDFFFGSLLKDGSLDMNPWVRKILYEKIRTRRSLCVDCFCYWHCAGDCPSKTFTPEKDAHLSFGNRCDLNRTITARLLARYISDAGGIWHGKKPKDNPFMEV